MIHRGTGNGRQAGGCTKNIDVLANDTGIDLQKAIFSDKGKRIGHLDGQTVVAESSDENTSESKPGVYELDGTNLLLIGDESNNAAYVNLSNPSE